MSKQRKSRFFRVKRRRCPTCIYRKGMGWHLDHLEAQIADPKMEGFFVGYRECHHAKRGGGVCCRGFWDHHKDDFTAGQIAQRLNLVEFVD